MKIPLLAFVLIFSGHLSLRAQDSLRSKQIICRVVIRDIHSKTSRGYLIWFTDSAMYLSEKKRWYASTPSDDSSLTLFQYPEIQRVQLSIANGSPKILISAAVGMTAGITAGLCSGDDPPDKMFSYSAAEKALALGTLGFGLGAIAGAIMAHPSRFRYHLNGDARKFLELELAFQEKVTRSKMQ